MQKHDTNVNTQNSDSNPSQYKETFFIVPREIIEMEGITFSYVRVYETMHQFWNKGLNVYMSQATLMDRTNLSSKQIYQALKFFEDNGKLVRRYVNGKRYLVRPEISIETDIGGSPTGDGGVTQRGLKGSPTGDHNIKKGNKEYNNINNNKEIVASKPKPPKQKSSGLAVREIENQNPHQIPLQMIQDWIEVRRASRKPVTATAWTRLTNQLGKCKNPVDAFETMVSHGWMSLNYEWIENMENQKAKNKTKSSKAWESTDWVDRV